jgi:hypothetical protein
MVPLRADPSQGPSGPYSANKALLLTRGAYTLVTD